MLLQCVHLLKAGIWICMKCTLRTSFTPTALKLAFVSKWMIQRSENESERALPTPHPWNIQSISSTLLLSAVLSKFFCKYNQTSKLLHSWRRGLFINETDYFRSIFLQGLTLVQMKICVAKLRNLTAFSLSSHFHFMTLVVCAGYNDMVF